MEGLAGRLRWRCRRGMKELDALLVAHLDRMLGGPTCDAPWQAFETLLDCEDDQLWDWLSGRIQPPDAATDELVQHIRRPA